MSATNDSYYPDPETLKVSAKILVGQAIERRWTHVLNVYEVRLLQRLCDLTVQWGNTEWQTSLGRVVDGNITAKIELGPIGFSRRTCEGALSRLVDKGLIEATVVHDQNTGAKAGYRFRPNVELILAPWEKKAMPPILPTPKRLKSGIRTSCATPTQEVRNPYAGDAQPLRTSCAYNTDTYTSNLNTFKDCEPADADLVRGSTAHGRDPSLFDDATEARLQKQRESAPAKSEGITSLEGSAEKIALQLAATAQRNATKRAGYVDKAVERIRRADPRIKAQNVAGGIKADDLRKVWDAAFLAHSPDGTMPVAWTDAERGIAMNLFRRWPRREDGTKPNGEFDEFLMYVVEDWGSLSAKELGWMDVRPLVPSIKIIAAFTDKFVNAFVTRKRKARANELDVDAVEELVLKGMSQKDAIAAVVARKVKSAVRREAERMPPVARVRSRPAVAPARPVQPVAKRPTDEERGLPESGVQPTDVVRQRVAAKSVAEWEAELFGNKGTDNS